MALYSVVVPVYNSENSLEILYERIAKVFDEQLHQPFELILVDDCSGDSSYQVVKSLVARDSRVKGVQLAVNHGQQKAVLCGFHYVKGDYIITMDDDLQHPPEQIPVLIEKMSESDEIDVVIGAYEIKRHGPIRRFGSWLMDLSHDLIYHKPKDLKMTSFRLLRRYVVDNLNRISISQPTVGPLLLLSTKRIVNVIVKHDERAFGHSGYTFSKLVSAFLKNLVTNSDLPLKIVRDLGLGIGIAGWTSTIVLLLFFGGMTMFSIGVLGRYLISIMLEAKKYPPYMIRSEDMAHDNIYGEKEI